MLERHSGIVGEAYTHSGVRWSREFKMVVIACCLTKHYVETMTQDTWVLIMIRP